MAGLSLQCGDCGALFKSVEEAQQHAELTSHSNFSESTEAVLNLVCTACGKPCRSKTESDLHTKRTGHTEFADKTLEAAKPISLEARKVDVEAEDGGDASASKSEEMVVPEVNKNILEELEAMGFPTARATRALFYSGNASLEAAVNWVVEHENDPEIDQMPLVPKDTKVEAPKPSLTPEQLKAKQQELRYRVTHRDIVLERIRIGKELLEAKRIEEENERKRILALRKAEKEEEKRAREKIRQKLEEDKAERRRRLGLPPEDPSTAKPPAPVVEEKKMSLPVRPASKAEQMRECLRSLKSNHKKVYVRCGLEDQDRGVWKTYIISFGIANMQDMLGAILCRSSMLVLLGKGTFMQQSRNFSTIQHLERDRFLWFVGGVCCDLRSLGEWKDRVFRGRDKEPCEATFYLAGALYLVGVSWWY
ncbi:chromatin assembly factor 1 subunit A [Cucumis melo var. makuwa]|uniref:Chromatin assembly factor 1 subunit A n=1 Tax=Cucumis melo var. makuwa TaxID=1194695 RepID=A0A5A7SV28_CUCMM|nr:chromatin assembly factor 1 subunit A [Cucumis melo var. makuwa]